MLRSGRVAAASAALFAVACVESHVPVDPVPLAGFCDGFFDALCEPLRECGCGEASVLACRGDQHDLCAGFPSDALVRAIDEERVRYDGSEAAALFARMRSRSATCDSFAGAIDWRVRDLFTIGGVFVGSVPAGEPCEGLGFELIGECALGICTPDDVCQAVVGEGAACDALHVCADLDAALTLDLGVDGLAMRCADGTCTARVEVGGACASGGDCASGACELGVCVARRDGEACTFSRECVSDHCVGGACAAGEASDGAPCESPSACASRVCVDGVCLPPGCGTF